MMNDTMQEKNTARLPPAFLSFEITVILFLNAESISIFSIDSEQLRSEIDPV
jgi:hypothetical protein